MGPRLLDPADHRPVGDGVRAAPHGRDHVPVAELGGAGDDRDDLRMEGTSGTGRRSRRPASRSGPRRRCRSGTAARPSRRRPGRCADRRRGRARGAGGRGLDRPAVRRRGVVEGAACVRRGAGPQTRRCDRGERGQKREQRENERAVVPSTCWSLTWPKRRRGSKRLPQRRQTAGQRPLSAAARSGKAPPMRETAVVSRSGPVLQPAHDPLPGPRPPRGGRRGGPVAPAGQKQRAVLALLVLNAGRVVSTDSLIESAVG